MKLSWQSAPREALGFRVYRRAEAEKEASLVATPAASGWIDTATAFGKRYAYSVQAVVKTGHIRGRKRAFAAGRNRARRQVPARGARRAHRRRFAR